MAKKLGNTRVTGTEQYYTPKGLASELVVAALDQIPDSRSRAYLEPAGGTGSFLDALVNH